MKNLEIILVNLIVGLIISFPTISFAQDWTPISIECIGDLQVFEVNEGEPAPVTGQLLTNDAAACLAVRLESTIDQCNLEIKSREDLCQAEVEFLIRDFEIRLEAREEQIEILEDELAEALEEPWFESFGFQFSTGVVIGAAGALLVFELLND